MSRVALDTNILVYSHDKNSGEKQNISRDLIVRSPMVCAQVVSEYISVLKRILKIPKAFIISACMPNLQHCRLQAVDIAALQAAERLVESYDFQIFDAIIVAAALHSGCHTLYSEDMQHQMNVDGQLTIINPFL